MSQHHHMLALAARQRWFCIWCEFPMARDAEHARLLVHNEMPRDGRWVPPQVIRRAIIMVMGSFEHVTPRSEGGSDARTNGLAACRWCNTFRGTEDPRTFKARVMDLVRHRQHPRQLFRQEGVWPPAFPSKLSDHTVPTIQEGARAS